MLAWQVRLRRALAVRAEPGALFVLVTPLGMPDRERLRTALRELGIQVAQVQPVPRFAEAALAVYARRSTRRATLRAMAYAHAWRQLGAGDEGEVWWLTPRSAHARLQRWKRRLRRVVGFWLTEKRGRREAALHGFHLPDPARLDLEGARLRYTLV